MPDAPQGATIFVRRFLCLACRKATRILPEEVHPRRWYAGAAVLIALARYLVLGWSAEKVRAAPGYRGWRAVGRWTRQLLDSLWLWKAAELGHVGGTCAVDRSEATPRSPGPSYASESKPPDVSASTLAKAARNAALGTVHDWPERQLISRIA